jgi:trk system potassium uptake protein TrkH
MEMIWRGFGAYVARYSLHARPLSPTQIVALSFAVAILIGGTILSLPIAHAPGHRVNFLDAIFTATSAICVTGLTVVDTGATFNRFGQVVIILLVQIGGFGVITLGTLVAFLSGRRIGFKERMNLQTQFNSLHVGGVVKLIKRILILILGLEFVGAMLLLIRFVPREGWSEGIFYALFHSVSAFNNAGFGLYADSMMQFVHDPIVNFTIMGLVVLGGLGFIVVIDLLSYARHYYGRKPLSLHTKIVLTATAILIVCGTLVILIFEWSNPRTLGPMSIPQKLLASLFQSVTPRTAGFNTLDYGVMRDGTLIFTMLLMVIGGSPGSTAGGIKTVTFFVLLGSAWSISRGRGELVAFGRRLSMETVVKSGSIALLSMMVLGAAATLLTFTDTGHRALALGFEAVSAFGTVGLSTGITPRLNPLSEIIIMLLMYLGRLGPLTLALALVEKSAERRINYPAEDIIIG